MGDQLRLGDNGHTLEILEIGSRDQLIQVLQAQLVLRQDDNMLGVPAAAAPGPQLLHLPVDLLQTGNSHLPPHSLKKGYQHIPHHPRVVRRPVVVEGGQIQMLRHDVQLMLVQLRQQVLRQDEAVDVCRVEFQPRPAAPCSDEPDVELRIVGRQRSPVHEFQKRRQCFLRRRRVRQHGIRNARQADDLRRQPTAGVHEGLKRIRDLPVFQHHCADLRDGLPLYLQSGSFNVEAHDLVVKVLILRTVYGNAVVQVVDVVPLHAVQDLDLPLARVPRLWECLHRAVVGNGNSRVAPGCRLLYHLAHIRQSIHAAHLRMQVQLHPLLRCIVLPGRMADLHNIHRPQQDILPVVGQLHLALQAQPHPVVDRAAQHLGLFFIHGLPHGHGAALIGDVEVQRPHSLAPRLIALCLEYPALHNSAALLDIQFADRRQLSGDRLAPDHPVVALLLAGAAEMQQHLPQIILLRQHLLQGVLRRLGQCLTALYLHLQRPARHIQCTADDTGVVQQQAQLPRRLKALKQRKKRYSLRHVSPLSYLLLQLVDLLEQRVHQPLLRHFSQNLSLSEQQSLALASGDAHIRGSGLTRSIDHAPHHCHGDGLVTAL